MRRIVYPVPRPELAAYGPSVIQQVPFASPTENTKRLLFRRPLTGIIQAVVAVAASSLIAFTPPLPVAAEIPKVLSRAPQSVEELAPSHLINPEPLIEQGLASLLFRYPFAGIFQEVVVPPPSTIRTPEPIIEQGLANLLFQKPAAGIVQPIVVVRDPIIIEVPIPDVAPTPVSVLFQRPMAGRIIEFPPEALSDLVVIPTPDIAPPAPSLLFLYPLAGKDYPLAGLELRSILGPGRLTSSPIPANVLFQRPFIGLPQEVVDPGRPRILRVQTPDPPAVIPPIFFLRPLTRGSQPVAPEYVSTLLFGLDPERSVLFLRPLSGREQSPSLVGLPKVTRVTPDIALPPLDILFERPRLGRIHEGEDVGLPRIVRVLTPDVAPSPINVLFQHPLAGPLEPFEIFRRPDIVRVLAATIPLDVLFQRPLIGLEQLGIDLRVPDIVRVRAADPPPDPRIVLFQWALAGVLQPGDEPGPGAIIRRSYTETPQLISGITIIIDSYGNVYSVEDGTSTLLSPFVMILND